MSLITWCAVSSKGGLSGFVFLLRKLSAPVFGYALRVSVATVVGAHLLRAV